VARPPAAKERRRPARLALKRAGRLSRGERIAALAAILLFGSMFLPWFGHAGAVQRASQAVGYTLNVPEITSNAWQDFGFIDIVLLLAALSALAAALLPASGRRAELGRNMCRAAAGLGSLSVLLVLFRLIDPPGGGSLRAGAFIGLLAAGAIAVGAYFLLQERGVLLGDGSVPGRRERRKESSRPRPKRAGA
jgi:hypothetical protein